MSTQPSLKIHTELVQFTCPRCPLPSIWLAACAGDPPVQAVTDPAGTCPRHTGLASRVQPRKTAVESAKDDRPSPAVSEVDPEFLDRAVRHNERQWNTDGRAVSAERVRQHPRVGSAKARALARAAKKRDRPPVADTSPATTRLWPWVPSGRADPAGRRSPGLSARKSLPRTPFMD
jgi:hypothetical protein